MKVVVKRRFMGAAAACSLALPTLRRARAPHACSAVNPYCTPHAGSVLARLAAAHSELADYDRYATIEHSNAIVTPLFLPIVSRTVSLGDGAGMETLLEDNKAMGPAVFCRSRCRAWRPAGVVSPGAALPDRRRRLLCRDKRVGCLPHRLSKEGATLLDGTTAENASLIERNIQAVGVSLHSVKLLISDHAHPDHVGALAQVKQDTGAKFLASAADTWALTHGQSRGDGRICRSVSSCDARRRIEGGVRDFARRWPGGRAMRSPRTRWLGLSALMLALFCGNTTAKAAPTESFYLTGGTVISMVPGQQPYNATVLVKDGRIAAIAQHPSLSAQDRVVDISGRYLLPGFIDMHAHVTFLLHPSDNEQMTGYDRRTSELVLRELLAAGVTTVRNPAAPPAEGVRLRDDVAAGRILGPRIFTAGWPLNGKPSTAEGIRAEVDRQCALKVDYIKVYANSTPRQTAAAIDEAHKCGTKVIGHLQATDWPTATDLGIDFITHGVSWSASTLPAAKRAQYEAQIHTRGAMKARIFWLESVDVNGPEMDTVIASLTRHRISVDPTLVAYETKFVPLEKYRSAENVSLAPPAMQETWRSGELTKDWSAEDFARMKRAWPKMLAIISRYYREGVLLTTGTDLPNAFVVPGVSLHQEMQLLTEAGIPAAATLAMSTRNAAIGLGQASDIGTIEVGKRADLVVLDQSPLTDIRNTRRVDLVVANGVILRPAALRAKVVP